jgi:hypothetical protein
VRIVVLLVRRAAMAVAAEQVLASHARGEPQARSPTVRGSHDAVGAQHELLVALVRLLGSSDRVGIATEPGLAELAGERH